MIIDVSRTSSFGKIHFRSHRSRNVRSANHFQTISPYISLKYTKKGRFLVCFKTRVPNYSSFWEGYSLPCWIQHFHLCQILITRLSWKPDTVEGGGAKIQLTSMSRSSTWGIFYREEEIAGLIVLGSCPWSLEGFVNHVNNGTDEGLRAPFKQAAVRAPLIIWSGPDCRGAGGRYIRLVWGQDLFQLTGLLRLQHTCRLKIDSPLLCISSLSEFISFIIDLSSLLSWTVCF